MNSLKYILIEKGTSIGFFALIMLIAFSSGFAFENNFFLNPSGNSLVHKSIECDDGIISYNAPDSIPAIWNQIDLTSPRMKQEAKVFPWWIPVAGAAAGGGIILLVLADGDEETPLVVVDDIVNIECGTGFTLDPTLNDTGSGIRVVSITGGSAFGVSVTGNIISFPATINMGFSFMVNLEDAFGNTAQSTVTVNVRSTPLEISDRVHDIELNENLTENIFDGTSCTSCTLESFIGDTQHGNFSITSGGTYTFIPNTNFIGRAIFILSIRDNCNQTISVQIIINVKGEPCLIEPTITTSNTSCGLAEGSINIVIAPIERYNIIWEDGEVNFERLNLEAGEYTFRIIDILGLCEDEFTVIIEESPLNLINNINVGIANCLGGGEINISTGTSGLLEYNITYEGNTFLQFSSEQNLISLQEIENILPGAYLISVNTEGGPERCAETREVIVEEVELVLEAIDDIATININTIWQGNVLSNDTGTGIFVVDFEPPINGTATILANGEATFTPNDNFSGIVIFEYTIQDTCGNEKSAFIRIEVLSECIFTTDLTTSPSLCGLNNGRANITILPASGQYLISWSNGQMGNQVSNLSPGTYSVTVTDLVNDCIRSLMFNITEEEGQILDSIDTENATCLEEGRIFGTFNSLYSSPFRIEVFYENEFQGAFQFNNFVFDLKPVLNLKAGTYRLVFTSIALGNLCSQEITVVIEEDDLPIDIVNDSATININTIWVGNVLNNDTGTGLQVISFTQSPHGIVMIQQTGDATFNPNLNFVGETSFTYTVRDTCGAEATGNVYIEVVQNCTFTGIINTTAATCGENDGSATLVLVPPGGNYEILWSSGDVGLQALNLPSGQISVTVTDITNNCNKVFVSSVEEVEPIIVENVDTSPATCTGGGNIFGTFDTNYPGSYRILVFRNGIFLGAFNFAGPNFSLDEVLQIIPGNYSLIISSLTYNTDCTQRILIEVEDEPTPIIINNDTFETPQNTGVSGNLLNNDIGEGLILVDITPPDNGSITFMGNGSFTYIPDSDFVGVETLVYTVIDICNTTAMGNLRIVVMAGPSPSPQIYFEVLSDVIKPENSPLIIRTNVINSHYFPGIINNPDDFQNSSSTLPNYSIGINSFIVNRKKNIYHFSFGSTQSILPFNTLKTPSAFHLTIQTGKTFHISKNLSFFSMVGTGMNFSMKRLQTFPDMRWTNGMFYEISKQFTLSVSNGIIRNIYDLSNLTELRILNKF